MRMNVLAALFALLPLAVSADEELVTSFELENGMQVVVVEDHRAPVVQHMVWYRVGSADEPPGASGVSHFLEHLMFKGTDTMEQGELSSTVARNGGRDNAFTSFDYTAYFQRVAADRLGLMMQMEADRMQNLRLTKQHIVTERNVIIEERNQRVENNPARLFDERMRAALYINHGYGVPIIGWMHEMIGLEMDDVLDFYDRFYAPNNAILVVSGDVTPEEVRVLAEEHYGPIPANPDLQPRTRTTEPPQNAERRLIFRDVRVAQPYVRRSYMAPERDSGKQEMAAALLYLAEILGGGTTSFLSEELQFDQKLATYTGAFYSSVSLDETNFTVLVVPRPEYSLQEAEDALDAALEKFMETGVDEEQLERIKFQFRADQVYARDDVDRIANRYGRALTSGLTVEDVKAWPDVLEAVTADDIMAAAREVFDKRASVTGWLMREEVTQ